MKKLTLLALFCAAMMLPAAAQWTPDDNSLVLVDNDPSFEYYDPTMIRKADGSSLLAYESFGFHINPETGQKEDERHFYLRMQKLARTATWFGRKEVLSFPISQR